MSKLGDGRVDELYDQAPCGLLVTAHDDRITSVNSTFLEWTGYTRDQLIGRDFHTLLDAGGQAFYMTRYLQELAGRGRMREVAFTLIKANGAHLPILVNAQLAPSETAGGAEARLAVFDATARHTYEREMLNAKRLAETSESSVRALQQASSQFQSAANEEELAHMLSRAARTAFAAFDSAVLLSDGRGGFRSFTGEEHEAWLLELSALLPETTGRLNTGVVVLSSLDDVYELSTEAGDLMRRHRTEALTGVQIADGDRVLGALISLFGRPRQFDEAALDLQRALVRQASPVLSRLRLQNELEQLAMHDQLTGLANRTLLADRITKALSSARRDGHPMAVVFVDLDGFKAINDELGHRAGDLVLQTVADRMSSAVRADDTVGRFGGDEFIVICDEADEVTATIVAERLASDIRQAIEGIPERFALTASVGVAVFDPRRASVLHPDALVLLADEAMYRAKKSGRDRITVVHVAGPPEEDGELSSLIVGAAARGELFAVFQPQIDLATRAIVAVEGLCRWNEPSRGVISPDTFIPLAEKNGAILEIGAFMLNEGCALLDRLERAGTPLDVSINVSPRQLGAEQLIEEITFQTLKYGFDASRLTLEITETEEIYDLGGSVAELRGLRELGVGISIDDFGTGFSSEEQVRQLPATELKIDRSIVQALGAEADERLASIVEFARANKARVIAEGVETPEQDARVRFLGCERAQGYLYGRPGTVEDIESLIDRGDQSIS